MVPILKKILKSKYINLSFNRYTLKLILVIDSTNIVHSI